MAVLVRAVRVLLLVGIIGYTLHAGDPGLRVGLGCGFLAGLLYWVFAPTRRCPRCEEPFDGFREPSTFPDLLLGRWRCPRCGAHLTARGKLLGR